MVDRVINTDDIENRKSFLQLFFCQRAPEFAEWWGEMNDEERHGVLVQCGVPLATTPVGERLATFPKDFNVETMMQRLDPMEGGTAEPSVFEPFDGALRTWAIVSDPLTEWAPRVSDEAYDWLQVPCRGAKGCFTCSSTLFLAIEYVRKSIYLSTTWREMITSVQTMSSETEWETETEDKEP